MAWLEHALQISLKRDALLMEDKMTAGALGVLQILGEMAPLTFNPVSPEYLDLNSPNPFDRLLGLKRLILYFSCCLQSSNAQMEIKS